MNHTVSPVKIDLSANTGAIADLADLSDVVADNMVYVIVAFTACSIARTIVRGVIKK